MMDGFARYLMEREWRENCNGTATLEGRGSGAGKSVVEKRLRLQGVPEFRKQPVIEVRLLGIPGVEVGEGMEVE
jgi:hypothetical protein